MRTEIRILIIEDEPHARDKLKHFIAQLNFEGLTTLEVENGLEALEVISTYEPHVLIADIHMPHLSGLECIKRISQAKRPLVIFTTAHEEYALEAFELNAVDYLLKPFSLERFSQSVNRVVDQLMLRRSAQTSQDDLPVVQEATQEDKDIYIHRIRVESSNRAQTFLSLDEVHLIKSAGNYCEFFTNTQSYLRRGTLKRLATRLSPTQFIRLNRSEIVQVSHIKAVEVIDHGDVIVKLKNGSQHRWSRHYRSENGDLFEV
jgi:two-component system LytT family response regulator